MVSINAAFDGGNIIPLSTDDPAGVQLEIRKDNQSDFYQWFSFHVGASPGEAITLNITNAAGAAYVRGWDNYRAAMSVDGVHWQRIDTAYEGGTLRISLTMPAPRVHIAYFAPYPMTRHDDLVSFAVASGRFAYHSLGKTLDGRSMDYLRFGEGVRQIWLIARQHPGETMAEWWMEGAIHMLADPNDPTARTLHSQASVHIIPNMNPDGSFRGHLRTNAAGVNLNRVWDSPTAERCPEVLFVRQKMHDTGVDLCLDVHGDEALPYNFIAGFDGIPGLTDAQAKGYDDYTALLERLSPDFQTKVGYPKAPPGKANLSMATNYIAEAFGAVAMTLEMPFKDTVDTPHPDTGWSPERSKTLARHCLQAAAIHFAAA